MEETELNGESKNIVNDNISKLKELFPEVVTEDKIDFDKLKLELGENIETNQERYQFTWPGKTQAIKESQKTTTGTLRPCKEESKNWDTTENLYIEGDNLEVLKILQKSYNNKIKMIYLDPPYNTGKDFVYNDNYKDNLKHYLEISGQTKKTGERERDYENVKITTNSETNGRYHSNWLNMMYPRLKLTRNILTEDGIIFISIDDNEVENLRKICDEIFGEENFIAQIIVEGTPKNDPYIVSTAHEYCLVYSKNFNEAKNANYGISNPLYQSILNIYNKNKYDYNKIELELKSFYEKNDLKKNNISNYKFADDKGVYRTGPIDDPQHGGPKDERLNPLTNTPCITPSNGWRCSVDTWNQWLNEGLILFPKNNNKLPSKKTYIQENRLDVMRAYYKIQTRKDTNDLKDLFNMSITPFSNPKPKKLIMHFIENCNDENAIYLDIFSGSATTAESVIRVNNKDNGNRKFILIQIPEKIKITGSNKEKKIAKNIIKFLNNNNKKTNICEIGKERIRRAGDKILEEAENKNLDIGFKVFKLDSSNVERWDPDYNNDIGQTLLEMKDVIKQNRTKLDLVYEVMLKYGLDLTLPIEIYEYDNTLYSVSSGSLILCLDNNISKDITEKILEIKGDSPITRVVFNDSGFVSDEDKTNIKEILRINNITEFVTI